MRHLFEFQCWVKHFYRHGKSFHEMLSNLENSAQYSSEALLCYQSRVLQRIITHCYRNVPYYRDLFRELSLLPEDIKTPGDLVKLPVMDKFLVKENYDKLIAKSHYNWLCRIGSTSGSTGSPAYFMRDYDSINFENAAVWRHWRKAGDYGKSRVTIRGEIIVPTSQEEPPFWKFNPTSNELLMSAYHLSFNNSRIYIDKILSFRPSVMYCYPSTAYLLAKFFRFHQVPYRFDTIFTSSEFLSEETRHYIESSFQCQVYDWYGQAERVAAISQCTYGTYHIQEDYSLVELHPDRQGEELVGTHLFNYVMPLLRYRTHDYVRTESRNCPCGSSFRAVTEILGRNYQYLLTPEGHQISITNHIPRGVNNLLETQFYQEKPGEVILRVLTNGNFTENDKALLIQNTLAHTSPRMKVIVKEVPDIPRGPNGKFVSIINKTEVMGQS